MIVLGSILSSFKTLLSKPGTYGWIIAIVVLVVCLLFWRANKRLASEVDRQNHNYSVLDGEFIKEQDKNGKVILKYQELQLTVKEIERSKDSVIMILLKETGYSNIKIKNLEDILFITQRVVDSLEGTIQDTMYITLEGDTVQWLSRYNDGYLDATSYIMNSMKKTSLEYIYNDSIYSFGVGERDPLRLFGMDIKWLKWGEKEYYQEIKFANPRATPLYSKKIKIYKNKREYRKNN